MKRVEFDAGKIPLRPLKQKESVRGIKFGPPLPDSLRNEAVKLAEEINADLTDVPLRTGLAEFGLTLLEQPPVRTKQ